MYSRASSKKARRRSPSGAALAARRSRFELEPVAELRRLGEQLLDTPDPGRFTDVLLMRLDAGQAKAGANLPELVRSRRAKAG